MTLPRDVPEPWATLLVRAGLVDKRSGAASMSRLSEESSVHVSTISDLMYGARKPMNDTVNKLADAITALLRTEDADEMRKTIHEYAGRALSEASPFKPHRDADLLTLPEREAVNQIIGLMVDGRKAKAPASPVADIPTDELSKRRKRAAPKKAVAQDVTGKGAASADEADEIARQAREKQLDAIREMERKKREKGEDT